MIRTIHVDKTFLHLHVISSNFPVISIQPETSVFSPIRPGPNIPQPRVFQNYQRSNNESKPNQKRNNDNSHTIVNMMNLKISTLLLLIVLSCLALSATTTITAAAPPAAQLCRDTLDPSKINDDYCDCEVDGSDETETSACSHVHILTPNSQAHEQPNRFLCRNQGYISANIHTSKTHDGICGMCIS